jgi:hypothetical protein
MTLNSVTTTSAVAAVSSPWWLPLLQATSEYAALILPILGAAVLVAQLIQMVMKLRQWWKRPA